LTLAFPCLAIGGGTSGAKVRTASSDGRSALMLKFETAKAEQIEIATDVKDLENMFFCAICAINIPSNIFYP
jgi:hypothetical protein